MTRVVPGTLCKKPRRTNAVVKRVPRHMPTRRKPTQNLTPPHGLIRTPTHSPVCPFDCQYVTVPDRDESESWTPVNKHRVCECGEGTERHMSVGGTDYWYRSSAQRGIEHKHPHTEYTSQLFNSKIIAKL